MGLLSAIATITASISSGSSATVQPSSGEEWAITAVGHAGAGIEPTVNMDVYLTNGTTVVMIRKADATNGSMWSKPLRWLLTNSIYGKLKNVHASANRMFYGGTVTRVSGSAAGAGDVKNGISAAVASGAFYNVQPPSGEDWALFEVGSSQWLTPGSGSHPDVEIHVYDGTNSIIAALSNAFSLTRPFRFPFNNSVYLRIKNTNASAADLAYSAQVMV